MIHLLRHAATAFGPVPLLYVAVVSVGFALATEAGLMGLPLYAILASWTAKYWFVLLESAAHGQPPPVLSIEMVNPFDERRPLGALLIVATVVALVVYLRTALGPAPARAAAALSLAFAPAAAAVLAIEGSVFRALNPLAAFGVARVLGATYATLIVVAIASGAVVALLDHAGVPRFATTAIAVALALAYAGMLGGALFDRRVELGLEAVAAPERAIERERSTRGREFDRAAEEIYALVRARQLDAAWRTAERWLAAHRDADDWAALLARAERWSDTRIADRLRRELVGRLHAIGRGGDALLAIESAWKRGLRWSPASARELAALVRLADDVGHAATAERLLDECPAAFASDDEVRLLRTRRGR